MKRPSFIKYSVFIMVVCILLIMSCGKVHHYELSRFVSPETCGGCHDEIYSQWKGSLHSLSHKDEIYRAVALNDIKGITDPDELAEAELCVKCHTPVGYVSGYPLRTSDDHSKVKEIAREGIQCDFCHSSTGAKKLYNAMITLRPGWGEEYPGIKRGPFFDSKSDYHGSAYSKFHTTSEVCAVCHDVRHVVFGTKLETPYEEWKAGPYNNCDPEKRVTCQGCHMYHRPGFPATGSTPRPENPGRATPDGPKRDHIFTHYFVGGNSFTPPRHGSRLHSDMAVERLKNAAELSINTDTIDEGIITVTVRNTGAGHKLPTGLTDVRQMWLEVTVRNNHGRILYKSGHQNTNGYLGAEAIIYHTVFGDGTGKPVRNLAKARQVLKDNRIPPGGKVEEKFLLPAGVRGDLNVSVRLLYRLAPQRIVDRIMGRNAPRLPVVEMNSVRVTASR